MTREGFEPTTNDFGRQPTELSFEYLLPLLWSVKLNSKFEGTSNVMHKITNFYGAELIMLAFVSSFIGLTGIFRSELRSK